MMSQPYNCIIENVCAIWCHLHNLKNMKNTHAGELLKVTLPWCFSRLSKCTNGTKSRKALQCKFTAISTFIHVGYVISS